MRTRHAIFIVAVLLAAVVPAAAAEKPETIKGNALYFPTQEEADAVKQLWGEPVAKQYAFLVGSAEGKDYVAAKPTTAFHLPVGKRKGKVVAVALVDRHGDVIAALVIESTDPELEFPALEALRRWKFEPARYKKTTVMSAVAVPLEFGK